MKLVTLGIILIIFCCIPSVFACSPLPQELYEHTYKRVKEKFDRVDSVELMTLISAKKVKVKMQGDDFEYEIDRATFRIDQVFKGKSKFGDIVVFDNSSSCAVNVLTDNRIEFDNKTNKVKSSIAPRQWLIYRNSATQNRNWSGDGPPPPPSNEITDSPMTRPIDRAFGDIKYLKILVANKEEKKKEK